MTRVLIMGAGYVGLAHALLFVRNSKFQVTIADINSKKIDQIDQGISPLMDKDIIEVLAKRPPNLRASLTQNLDYGQFDAIFLCLPTNYDESKNRFDTKILDEVLAKVLEETDKQTPIIIKSTLPIGYTQSVLDRYNCSNVIFSPEFLREGQALRDNLYPSRLVFGTVKEDIGSIIDLYLSVIEEKTAPILAMPPTEAESVKLFSNTYLAMRIAFFNELDTFSEMHGLESSRIIKAVGLDERIGRFYNNPSFGYGGYCLPKDSKQLRSNFEGLSADLIGAIVDSNDSRKKFIADRVLNLPHQVIGVYRLSMKQSSDNSRESAVFDIMSRLKAAGKSVIVFEPQLLTDQLEDGIEVIHDLQVFKERSQIILANRWHLDLMDVKDKVYSRDIFETD